MRIRVLMILFCFIVFQSVSQSTVIRVTEKEYIEKFRNDAIRDMQAHGIPASITLAQGMLESGNGNSPLAVEANNHFGIKCHNDWKGETYYQDDDKKNECFRKYKSAYESYSDHSEFLKTRQRYAFLFDLKPTDYKGWAKGLKEAGYATDPGYASKLIELIERHNLSQYDTAAPSSTKRTATPVSEKKSKRKPAREIELFNSVKSIIVKEGDNLQEIADEMEIEMWQLLKYNNLSRSDKLVKGHRLYLQPKRRKYSGKEYHIVQQGETMKTISRLYGVKLKHLYKKNLMKPGTEPKVGEKVFLNKKII